MNKIFIIILIAFSSLLADFRSLNDVQLIKAMKKNVVVIDIRRIDEWNKYGVIKKSHKLTFFDKYGKYDTNKWMSDFKKLVKTKKQPFILVCAHANRSKALGKMLSSQMNYKNVYELEGGINYGWIDKGYETVK